MDEFFELAGQKIGLGERRIIELHLARLYDYTELTLPIHVIRGEKPGPVFFVSGAIHGDELTGTAVVKRIINHKRLKQLSGTLIAIPIVNVFGFNNKSRYLPDRRDLNRCFPGSPKGSLAARIAHIFMKEIVERSDYGIDFHSAALHRTNLPQIRTAIDDPVNCKLAEVFGVPVILDSKLRDGSLREAASEVGVKILLFEGGEALRVDERIVKVGVRGALSVMGHIGMLPSLPTKTETTSYWAKTSYWVRAPQSGMIRFAKGLGSQVKEGTILGVVSDAFGDHKLKVVAPLAGIIIGQSKLPLVNKGDALYHIATFEDTVTMDELGEELVDYTDQFF